MYSNLTLKTLSFIFLSFYVASAHADLTLLVNAPRSPIKAQKKWSGVAQYLSEAVGETIKIVAVPPSQTNEKAKQGGIDLMIVNPVMSTLVAHRYDGELLATVERKSGSNIGGVILSKKGSGITKAEDLRGKDIMTYKKASAAAYTFQMFHLKEKGITESNFASSRISKRQDDIVLAVRAGVVDVGFVKTGLLEAMAKEGKIDLDDFEIVDQRSEGFAHVHSTILYPQWYLLATSEKGKKVSSDVSKAALSVSTDHAAAKKAKINGFVKPLSTKQLDKMLREMHMAPFNS